MLKAAASSALFAVVASTGACATATLPPPVGQSPLDDVALVDAPALRHIGAVAASGARARDLFALEVPLSAPPDPTTLLEETARNNAPVPGAQESAPLSILTWNLGLLDTTPLIPFAPRFRSPHIEERRRRLPQLIARSGFDIVLLQEVWNERDAARVRDAAERAGYFALSSTTRPDSVDGLMVLIKRSIVAGDARDVVRHAALYADQEALEALLGPRIRRGFLEVTFPHRELGDVVVFDTHIISFPTYWRMRQPQARHLGLAARAVAPGTLVVVGGDVNAGMYYRETRWTESDGYLVEHYWQNALAVPTLMHYGGLVDAVARAARGRGGPRAADEVRWGQRVTDPLDARFCDEVPRDVFTASDCNSLYRDQYADDEPPHRLDHIMLRALTEQEAARVHVVESGMLFTERTLPAGAADAAGAGANPHTIKRVEPSDHAAVFVRLMVRRR